MKTYKCYAPGHQDIFGLLRAAHPAQAAALYALVSATNETTGEELLSPPKPGESVDVCVVHIVGEVNAPWRVDGRPETYRVRNVDGAMVPTLVGQRLRPVNEPRPLNRFPNLN